MAWARVSRIGGGKSRLVSLRKQAGATLGIYPHWAYGGGMSTSLTSSAFWILTALASGRRHGYEIMLESAKASDGRVALKATTLYAALERLERDGLVADDGDEIVSGRARRYYRLTDQGATRLDEEARVLQSQARVALKRLSGHSFAFTRSSGVNSGFAPGLVQGMAQ